MYCPNCGAQNANDAKFCTSCGKSLIRNAQDSHEFKRIQMRCKACGGSMDVANEQNILVCPYCGSKELIQESDKVSAERIRANTTKDVAFGVMDRVQSFKQQKIEEERRKEAEQKEHAKKLLPLIIAFIGILLIICIIMALREESLMIHTPSYPLQPFTLNAVPIFFIGKFGPQKLSKADKELLKILVTPLLWICFPIIPIFKLLKLLFKH